MLKNDFYYIQSLTDHNGTITAAIEINPYHKIFEGHFPGQPVVPGVCMMEIIKEITETATGKEFFLHKADVVKFLTVIVPQKNTSILVRIKYNESETNSLHFEATLYKEDTVYLKFRGEYVAEYGLVSANTH